jgi:hypothetical protein
MINRLIYKQVCSAAEIHPFGENATPPSACASRRLAALQLVGIAGYSASSFERLRRFAGSTARFHLAGHRLARTPGGVQLPFPG